MTARAVAATRRRCRTTQGTLSRRELAARVAGMAAELRGLPQVHWSARRQRNRLGGRRSSPLGWPARRSCRCRASLAALQLEHILRDAGIDHVVATPDALDVAASLGTGITPISKRRLSETPVLLPGAGMIVYTSGSSGRPKGVRLGIEQIDWQAGALAAAIEATAQDLNLSVLPLALLLETITAICVPVLVGARTHFASAVAESVGAGRPVDLAAAFERGATDHGRSGAAIALGLGCAACGRRQAGAGQLALRRSRRRARLARP